MVYCHCLFIIVSLLSLCLFPMLISHHEHGALSIYNSLNVSIRNCTFCNNTSDSYYFSHQKQYQGSSAGLSVGYNMENSNVLLNITITDTDFINNIDSPLAKFKLTSSMMLYEKRYTGRGGGLSVLVNLNFSQVDCIISGCKFFDNFASSLGGALYIFIANSFNNQSYRIDKVTFSNNSAPIACGALCFVDLRVEANNYNSCIHTTVVNCTFINNMVNNSGGAVSVYSIMGESNVEFKDCEFYNNTAKTGQGGSTDVASFNFFKTRDVLYPVVFSNW